ncbi:TrmO family methyltransferase domain-containing protein [Fusibacter ferrireducens]|uniref:UvrABC system protein A n=1 Tax=Fusibacter ferrireducens TaxID=2785058 RepID=A0ABR9ZNQ5_9FIRM|nr:TrmO family methyltransferase [Fusibacter ferrireducens]MBF4692105.1 SAM-dependent methyltransferase [Fusibacter ferrireducens]
MKWVEIGSVSHGSVKSEIIVNLYDGYGKALNKLDLFSHCILFALMKDKVAVTVAQIIKMDESKAQLILKMQKNEIFLGQLVDIKPYFPVEEVILEAKEPRNRFYLNYSEDSIGEYVVQGRRTFIQLGKNVLNEVENGFKSSDDYDIKSNTSPIQLIEKGDYLRVLWWFHRFEKDSFRKNRMCKPPYNNAPRTGVFASRSPVRPNPIGSTLVLVEQVDYQSGTIDVLGFDGFPGTKILQVMFYQPSVDKIENAVMPKWVSHWTAYRSFERAKALNSEPKEKVHVLAIDFDDSDLCEALEVEKNIENEQDLNNINIHNAHIHNLKNLSVSIPKNSINLITGVSGSGKSSLAFDTIYAESQRQFMDLILSNQMLGDTFTESYVDKITGLQPAIAIKQQTLGANPRSTVGTVTRTADILKLIFATIGERVCPICHQIVDEQNVCSNCGHILFDRTPQVFSYNHPDYMCPVCKGLGVEMRIDTEKIVEHPERSLLDGAVPFYGDLRKHRKKPNANWMRGEILALADDLKVDLELPFAALPEAFKQQFFYGTDGREVSLKYENSKGRSGVITRPAEGAVPLLERLSHGTNSSKVIDQVQKYMSKKTCSSCGGERLRAEGRLIHIRGQRYVEVVNLSIVKLRMWCHRTFSQLTQAEQEKTKMLFIKLNQRLKRIIDVGLGYIALDRSIPSLSGGEAQRLKLATQFGTGLTNILYIMDEPSKGLHPKDYRFLMDAIVDLKNQGHTVVLVEHKKSFLSIADRHLKMGPKAGRYGGEIIAVENRLEILENVNNDSDLDAIEIVEDLMEVRNEAFHDDVMYKRHEPFIHMKKVSTNNLKNIDVKIPVGKITAVIGVSGSGKSSLISKTLYPYLVRQLGKNIEELGTLETVIGLECFEDVCYVNQKPIGSNSRSNPGTYTGVFDLIRGCYADTQEAKSKQLSKAHFSFNSAKGQCPNCNGLGEVTVDMHYMDDLYVPCNKCHGKRYSEEVLKVKRKNLSIGDILDIEIHDLLEVFEGEEEIVEQLSMLDQVGLGYLKLGQSASMLSGGEAQRIKLAKELYRKNCDHILYILDEPTTGLNDEDIEKVIRVLMHLKAKGATIIVIEHNYKMITSCDYIIELGPKGGDQGGQLMRSGYRKQ